MECARLYWDVQSSHPPRVRVCFVFPAIAFRGLWTLDLAEYNQGTWHPPVLDEACPPQGRTVAGSTEDGSCYCMPMHAHLNTFRAELDGRFNWSLCRTVVLHVTERSVIVAPFLPPLLVS